MPLAELAGAAPAGAELADTAPAGKFEAELVLFNGQCSGASFEPGNAIQNHKQAANHQDPAKRRKVQTWGKAPICGRLNRDESVRRNPYYPYAGGLFGEWQLIDGFELHCLAHN